MDYLEILELVSKKNQKGLEALYVSYGEKFYGYAITKWKLNEDQAWEVIYKTFETLTLKLSDYSFDSKVHFENFIFKVFINYLKQHYRNNRKTEKDVLYIDMSNYSIESDSKPLEFDFDTQSLSDYYQSESPENSKLVAINEALKKMDDQDRDILLLRAQNYSYDEIAGMLNIENEQLKVQHFRAKQKLIKLLQTQSKETI